MNNKDLEAKRSAVVCLHSSGSSGGQWRALRELVGHRYDLWTRT